LLAVSVGHFCVVIDYLAFLVDNSFRFLIRLLFLDCLDRVLLNIIVLHLERPSKKLGQPFEIEVVTERLHVGIFHLDGFI